jgi:hypothetical protein
LLPRLAPEVKQKDNEAFQPLAAFIAELPALEDVVWDCVNQVPPCILSSLDGLPGCRLHVGQFSMRSLVPMISMQTNVQW